MPDYSLDKKDIRFGGGDLLVNKTDSTYSDADFSKFASLGATDKQAGGILKLGERRIATVFGENDREEPARSWLQGQDVTFEVLLLESSIENFVLGIGGDPRVIGDDEDAEVPYKFYRGPDSSALRTYPMIYKAVDDSGKTTTLVMPACEIIGAADLEMNDGKTRAIKLTCKLHRIGRPGIVLPSTSNWGTELIVNGDFLKYLPTLYGWTAVHTGGWTVQGSVLISRTPPSSCYIKGSPLGGGEGSVAQSVTFEADKDYLLRLWYYATGASLPIRVSIGTTVYDITTSSQVGEWNSFETIFHSASAGSLAVKIRPMQEGWDYYLDDVTLRSLPANGDPGTLGALEGKKFEIRMEHD